MASLAMHAPAKQAWFAGQASPQAAQSEAVPSAVSQPSVRVSPSQSANPAAQAPLQAPPEQVRLAMPATLQASPQPPQWSGSTSVSRQELEQLARPAWQETAQAPVEHTWPAGQAVPQAP